MEKASLLVLFALLILAVFAVTRVIRLRKAGQNVSGTPSIINIHFFTGKIALFTPIIFLIVKSLKTDVGYFLPSENLIIISIFLLYTGVAGVICSYIAIGLSFRIGLPEERTVLRTQGIYKYSRNPHYLSFYLISISSCLYFPDLINFTLSVYGIIIHHLIILKEEVYLRDTFGEAYESYCNNVRRYI